MMRASTWSACIALLSQFVAGFSRVAWAAPPFADTATVQQAQERFRRGVSLYEEGDTAEALVELERAYELVPNFKLLYNLGQVSYQTRNYAAAREYFERYLADGGDQVVPARRRELEGELRLLKQRTGYIDVRVVETGSEISIDDLPVGTSPLAAPVLANVGRHRVEVVSASGQRRSRQIALAGDEIVIARFDAAVPVPSTVPSIPIPILPPSSPDRPGSAFAVAADEGSLRAGGSSHWLPWTLTAALAIGAAVTGGFALQRSSQAQDALGAYPASKSDVDSLRNNQHTFAMASDGFLIGTLVTAAVSLYLSLSNTSAGPAASPHQSDLARLDH